MISQVSSLKFWSDSGSSKSSFVTVTRGSEKLFGFGFAWKKTWLPWGIVSSMGNLDFFTNVKRKKDASFSVNLESWIVASAGSSWGLRQIFLRMAGEKEDQGKIKYTLED